MGDNLDTFVIIPLLRALDVLPTNALASPSSFLFFFFSQSLHTSLPRPSTRLLFSHLSPQPDYTRCNQFLYLHSNARILHMLLKRCRITLCLLQDALHDWILKNPKNL